MAGNLQTDKKKKITKEKLIFAVFLVFYILFGIAVAVHFIALLCLAFAPDAHWALVFGQNVFFPLSSLEGVTTHQLITNLLSDLFYYAVVFVIALFSYKIFVDLSKKKPFSRQHIFRIKVISGALLAGGTVIPGICWLFSRIMRADYTFIALNFIFILIAAILYALALIMEYNRDMN